jgi:hypothetical protein
VAATIVSDLSAFLFTLTALLYHYTILIVKVKGCSSLNLKVFRICCKSLQCKGLRSAGPAPPVLSRCHQRTYGDCLLQIVYQPYFSLPLRACGRDWSFLADSTPRYQNVQAGVGFEPTISTIYPIRFVSTEIKPL